MAFSADALHKTEKHKSLTTCQKLKLKLQRFWWIGAITDQLKTIMTSTAAISYASNI
jgi:hypothetical protein